MRQLRDMIVVITGASAGIGKALAERLAPAGAKLVLAARRVDRLEGLNRALGGAHLCVPTDVSRREDCEALIARAVEHFGRIDTLVCNAGYGTIRTVAEMSPQEMQDIFATNVFGTVDCIRAAVPVMARQAPRDGDRGQVVIVSSAAARRGLPFNGAYSATKAAQLSLAEAMRVELRPQGIAVTCVLPIGTETEFFQTAESASGRKFNAAAARPYRQSVEHVGRRMVRAIQRPANEVWPSRITRWLTSVGTLAPGLADRFMSYHRKEIERLNGLS